MKLDNPLLVRWEYASEERLVKRNSIFRALIEGDNPEDVAFDAVAESPPKRLLDVGCGPGDVTQRFADELGAHVCAVDISARMVDLAKARGLDAQVADAEHLPFAADDFDCVFAGWVLYHVPGLEQAIAECARVVRPDGRFVATCYRDENFSELWKLIDDGAEPAEPLSFNSENGGDLLGKCFARVERRDVEATLIFPTTDSIREFVASTIDRAHLAPRVPDIVEPLRVTTYHAIFVAEQPR
jgi:SAM-dependent methyltransferase